MFRIGISGIPSSGKTTLARALASACYKKFKCVELIHEFARQYITKNKSISSIWEQLYITDTQINYEDSVSTRTEILITDSPIYLGFLYAIDLVDFNDAKDLIAYNELFNKMTKENNRYDLIFHLNSEIVSVDDGIREQTHLNSVWRNKANFLTRGLYRIFGQKNVIEVSQVDIKERIEICLREIEKINGKIQD